MHTVVLEDEVLVLEGVTVVVLRVLLVTVIVVIVVVFVEVSVVLEDEVVEVSVVREDDVRTREAVDELVLVVDGWQGGVRLLIYVKILVIAASRTCWEAAPTRAAPFPVAL